MVFNQRTTGEEVAKAYTSRSVGKTCRSSPSYLPTHIALNSSTVVITGTTAGGIGAATAIALAHGKPRAIFLTGRNKSKTEPVIKAIDDIDPSIKTIFVELDLTDQDSIRKAANLVLGSGDAEKIHGLINNAGVMTVMPYTTTKQGIEIQFGTASYFGV